MSGIVLVVKPSFLFSGTSGNETLDNSFNVDISKDRIQKNDTGNLKHKAATESYELMFLITLETKPNSIPIFCNLFKCS